MKSTSIVLVDFLMKLFGDSPPPSWFAAEIGEVFQKGDDSREKKAMMIYIFQQGVKFLLTGEQILEDLQQVGVPSQVCKAISIEYEKEKEKLRKDMSLNENVVSIHSRVLNSEFKTNSEVILTLSDQDDVIHLTLEDPKALAKSLQSALKSFDSFQDKKKE